MNKTNEQNKWIQKLHKTTEQNKWTQKLHKTTEDIKWTQEWNTANEHNNWSEQPLTEATNTLVFSTLRCHVSNISEIIHLLLLWGLPAATRLHYQELGQRIPGRFCCRNLFHLQVTRSYQSRSQNKAALLQQIDDTPRFQFDPNLNRSYRISLNKYSICSVQLTQATNRVALGNTARHRFKTCNIINYHIYN